MELHLFELLDETDQTLYWVCWSQSNGPILGNLGETSQLLVDRYKTLHRIKDGVELRIHRTRLTVVSLCRFLGNEDGYLHATLTA